MHTEFASFCMINMCLKCYDTNYLIVFAVLEYSDKVKVIFFTALCLGKLLWV